MNIYDYIQRKINSIFDKLDHVYWNNKNLMSWYVPKWQYVAYTALIFYFIMQILFLKFPYEKTAGLASFIETIQLPFTSGTPVPILLNRGVNNGGHELAYMSLMFLAIFARKYMPKTSEGMYYSLLIPAYTIGASEGLFNIFFWSYNWTIWPHMTWDIFILTNPFAIFYVVVIGIGSTFTPVWKYLDKRLFYAFLLSIIGYMSFWSFALGLPVTLSSISYLNGYGLETQYFQSYFVNGLEIGQWWVASFTILPAIYYWYKHHITKQMSSVIIISD